MMIKKIISLCLRINETKNMYTNIFYFGCSNGLTVEIIKGDWKFDEELKAEYEKYYDDFDGKPLKYEEWKNEYHNNITRYVIDKDSDLSKIYDELSKILKKSNL